MLTDYINLLLLLLQAVSKAATCDVMNITYDICHVSVISKDFVTSSFMSELHAREVPYRYVRHCLQRVSSDLSS